MRSLVAAIAAVLVLSACQDPADVGLGLIDEDQLDPNVLIVPLTDLAAIGDTTTTIGIADGTNADLVQTRVLAGRVADPVFGDVRAIAYVDFLQSTSLPSDATADDVAEAWLELRRTYVYGDTTTVLPLDLRGITEDWSADTSYDPDRTLATGDVLSSIEVAVSDSLRRFDLPASWVAANAAALVGSSFGADFEGFAIQVPESFAATPGAVMGFDTFQNTGSGLRVVVTDGEGAPDTLVYPLSEVFTSIATEPPALAPTGVLAVRAGQQERVGFLADFGTVGPSALARARARIPIDESLAQDGAFVRPIPERAVLYGIRDDDPDAPRLAIAEVVRTDGELAVVTTTLLTPIVQRMLLDPDTAFDRYELGFLLGTASLDIFPIALPVGGSEAQPRFTLTVVGGSN